MAQFKSGFFRYVSCVSILMLVGVPAVGAQPAGVPSQSDPVELLAKMQRALNHGSYDGTFSLYTGSDLASLRVVHKVVDGERRERLVHLNGSPREVMLRGDRVTRVTMPGDLQPDANGLPAGSFSRAFVRPFESLNHNYRFAADGIDYVAGRKATCIVIQPKDAHRFGYRLWIDNEHHLLLRSELVNGNNDRLEILQFSQVVFGDEVKDAALESPRLSQAHRAEMTLESAGALNSAHSNSSWRAGWLPEGFEMSAVGEAGDGSSVHTMSYSDGLAAFTIFVELMPQQGAAMLRSRSGATIAINAKAKGPDQGEHLVTLVGELPTATAKKILGQVRYQP